MTSKSRWIRGALAIVGVLVVAVAFGPAGCRRPFFPRPPYHEPVVVQDAAADRQVTGQPRAIASGRD